MAEPQSMSRADVLAELADIAQTWPQSYRLGDRIAAIAAAVAGWCVVEGGHRFSLYDGLCNNCGQRRDEEGA